MLENVVRARSLFIVSRTRFYDQPNIDLERPALTDFHLTALSVIMRQPDHTRCELITCKLSCMWPDSIKPMLGLFS